MLTWLPFLNTCLGIITSLIFLFFGQKTLFDIVRSIRTKKIVPVTINPFLLLLCFISIVILSGTTIFLNAKLATLLPQATTIPQKISTETLGPQSSPSPISTLTATTSSPTPVGPTSTSSSPIKTTILSKTLACQSCPNNSPPVITLDNVSIDTKQIKMTWNITVSYPTGPSVFIHIDKFDLVGSDSVEQVGSVVFDSEENWHLFDSSSRTSATVTFTNFIPSQGEQLTLDVNTHEEITVGETYDSETFIPINFTYNGSVLKPS